MDAGELENRFIFHPALDRGTQCRHEAIRETFLGVAEELNESLPEGREKALAITKLEEGMFWANAAIARANPVEKD